MNGSDTASPGSLALFGSFEIASNALWYGGNAAGAGCAANIWGGNVAHVQPTAGLWWDGQWYPDGWWQGQHYCALHGYHTGFTCPTCLALMPKTVPVPYPVPYPVPTPMVATPADSLLAQAKARLVEVERRIAEAKTLEGERDMLKRMLAAAEPSK